MEIATSKLVPGTTLLEDVVGKSGKVILAKDTPLTNTHIEFLTAFLIDAVSIAPTKPETASVHGEARTIKKDHESMRHHYKKMHASWRNSVPIDMSEIRKVYLPFFIQIAAQPFYFLEASYAEEKEDKAMDQHIVSTILAVQLAASIYQDKKDWLQVGFASLLSKCGTTKLQVDHNQSNKADKNYTLYPLYSYKMVESITTLSKQAKIAILQHRERIDGSGFPAKMTGEKIHPFAQIIGLSQLCSEERFSTKEEMQAFVLQQVGRFDTAIIASLQHMIG